MNDKPEKISLDELLNLETSSDTSILPDSPKNKEDGEIPFGLSRVSMQELNDFKRFISQPTDPIEQKTIIINDFDNFKRHKSWAETFNGKIPTGWLTSGRSIIGFFEEMKNFSDPLYRYIPADWITATILKPAHRSVIRDIVSKCSLRPLDVLNLMILKSDGIDIEFDLTNEASSIYETYRIQLNAILGRQVPPSHRFFKYSLESFTDSRFNFMPLEELKESLKKLPVKELYALIESPSNNILYKRFYDEYYAKGIDLSPDVIYETFFQDSEITEETIYWADHYNFPNDKNLSHYQLSELLTRISLHNPDLDSVLVDQLITYPTEWYRLLDLSAFTKLTIAQNTTLFTRILCGRHPIEIQKAIMNQLLLGNSVGNVDIALGLAFENYLQLAVKASSENRSPNVEDFIEIMEETKLIENKKGFFEDMYDRFKDALKHRKVKKLRGGDEIEEG
jgi:hypothetical protein